ncbi:MAG: response regulator [Ignavibacteriae bacterium]|nr:MAG: response regulator [Ignavibacteriota bacterium]
MENLKRLLLVEDSENDVELILDALTEINIQTVDVVRNGLEALDFLLCRGKYEGRNNSNPVVVFLDIKMPKITGLELLRRMKGDDNYKTIPVVMFTSSKEESDIVKSYSLGANAYIVKPVDIENFTKTIKGLAQFWIEMNEPPPVLKTQNVE